MRVALAIAALYGLTASPGARATTHRIAAGGNLQAALDVAQPGDVIVLARGATFTGNFTLPVKPAGPVITVRSSASLPNRRIAPGDAALLPTIRSGNGMSAIWAHGTANWRLEGIRFEPNVGGHGDVIQLQDAANITLDRILLVVPEGQQQKRGVRGNGRHVTLTRSHIAGVWRTGQDSQAFCAWDGAGPYTITNNYLEAASENVMFGGANSKSPDRVPSDILIEGNHFTKRGSWKGQARAVKNLLELKQARRVIVRDNLFENNWTDAQAGWAILFKSMNDEGGSPWAATEGVLFERNIVRNTERGININGYDPYQPSGQVTRITIRHNVVQSSSTALQFGNEIGELILDHNTFVNDSDKFLSLYTGEIRPAPEGGGLRAATYAVQKLTITNTLAYHRDYGVKGDGAGVGTPSLDAYAPGYVWTHNVLAAAGSWPYPFLTLRPSVAEHRANFTADYQLTPASRYQNAGSDGQDLGASIGDIGGVPPPRNLRIVAKSGS